MKILLEKSIVVDQSRITPKVVRLGFVYCLLNEARLRSKGTIKLDGVSAECLL